MRLLFIFLCISGISYAQGKVMSRHANGQKEWVNVYTGTGINEKLTKRYGYEKHHNEYASIITYSTKGHPIEKKTYQWENDKRYLWKHETYSLSDGYKSTGYKPDGTLDDERSGGAVRTYEFNAIRDD